MSRSRYVAAAVLLVLAVFAAVGSSAESDHQPNAASSALGGRKSVHKAETASENSENEVNSDLEKWIKAKIVSKSDSEVGAPVAASTAMKVGASAKDSTTALTEADEDPVNSTIGKTLTHTLALVFVIGVIVAVIEFVARALEVMWLKSKNMLYLVVFERVRKELCMLGAASLMIFFFTESREVDRLLSRLTSTALSDPLLDLNAVWEEIHLAILYTFITLPFVAGWLAMCTGKYLSRWSTLDWTSTNQYQKGYRKKMVRINEVFVERQGLENGSLFLPYLKASAEDTMGRIFNVGWVTWMDVAWIGLLVCVVFRLAENLERSTLFVNGMYVAVGMFLCVWQGAWRVKAQVALRKWIAISGKSGKVSDDKEEKISNHISERSKDAVSFLWFKSRRLFLFGICENVVFTILYLSTLGVMARKQSSGEEWLVFGFAVAIGLVAVVMLPYLVNIGILVCATGDPNIPHFKRTIAARKKELAGDIQAAEEAGIKIKKASAVEEEYDIGEKDMIEDIYDETRSMAEKSMRKLTGVGYSRFFNILILKDYWLGYAVQKSTMREYAALFHIGVFDTEVQMKNIRNFVIAMVGVLLMIAELQVAWDGKTLSRSKTTNFLKFMMFMDTILLLIGIIDYYALQQKIFLTRHFVGRREFAKKVHLWNFPELWVRLLLELLVCSFHPFPFTDAIDIDDKWSLIMFLRLYLFIRIIRDATYVYRNRNFIKKAAEKADRHPTFNWALSCKILYHNNIGVANMFLWAMAVCVLSYCVYVCEREEQPEIFAGDGTMFYFTAVTMTTVGYGDISPKSRPGRVMAICIAFTGIILTSLFTAVVTNQLDLNDHQMFARDWVLQDQLSKREPHMAQTLIKETWRSYIRRNRNKNSPAVRSGQKKELWPKFKPSINSKEGMAQRLGMQPAFESRSIALSAQMANLRQRKAEINSVMSDPTNERLNAMEQRFDAIEKTQQEILALLTQSKGKK